MLVWAFIFLYNYLFRGGLSVLDQVVHLGKKSSFFSLKKKSICLFLVHTHTHTQMSICICLTLVYHGGIKSVDATSFLYLDFFKKNILP